MDLPSLANAGDIGTISRIRDGIHSRFLAAPVTAASLATMCREVLEFYHGNGLLACRVHRHDATPDEGTVSGPYAPIIRYMARLPYAFPYELERPEELFSLAPEVLAALAPVLLYAPPIFPRSGDPERYFEHFQWAFTRLHAVIVHGADNPRVQGVLETVVNTCNLIPLYFVDRPLTEFAKRRADLTLRLLRTTDFQLDLPARPPAEPGRRRRIGIFRNIYNNGSEVAALRAHIMPYDRSRYEIFLYGLTASGDSAERQLRDETDHLIILPDATPQNMVERIRADGIDMLLMGKNICGLTNFPWVMGAHRLAPIQVGFTLFPITSGLPSFDYYITGDLNERSDAAGHYTETLILTNGSINSYDFGAQAHDPIPVGFRQRMGLGPEVPVFASGANLYKVTPELAATWAAVLSRVPQSRLVLYPFNRNWTSDYPARLFITHLQTILRDAGVDPSRLIVLGHFADRREILGLLNEIDVYLDSFPFAGAVSLVDPLVCGRPVIALEGNTARCRQSTGFLHGLGLHELVAGSVEDYIDLAAALGNDPARRSAIAARVCQARSPTFPVDPALPGQFWQGVDIMFARQAARAPGSVP